MKHLLETLTTPVAGEYDVIVVGAGPAGCGAAISAGRCGAKVLLIEAQNALGGMWTAGMVNPLFDAENKKVGIIRELIEDLDRKGVWGGFRGICFNYEYMKALLEEKTRAAGVDVLYNTRYVAPVRNAEEGNRITGVITESISGRRAFLAKGVIDCSADALVAADMGVPCDVGDEDGTCQAMTLMFLVANMPEKYRNTDFMMYEQLNAAYEAEGKKIPFAYPYMINIPASGFAVIQFTHMHGFDPTDAAAITQATMEGRRQMIEAIELLKRHDPEFADLDLVYSAPTLGVRESRRIRGEYTLTVEDLLTGKKFEDGITSVDFNIDIHNGKNETQRTQKVKEYQIPYRSLVPLGAEGLLVAGRCISGTHEAEASYRVTADCCEMGEAAGYAMAYAAKHGILPRNVDVRAARAEFGLKANV